MKMILCLSVTALALLLTRVPTALAQENYTVIQGAAGPQVCVGTWYPPREPGLPGSCDGTVMSFSQFSALTARQSSGKLDQLLTVLDDIDQKMASNVDQLNQLIEVSRSTQHSINDQVQQSKQMLNAAIAQKFAALPKEMVENAAFKAALAQLKEEILKEVDQYYLAKPASPAGSR